MSQALFQLRHCDLALSEDEMPTIPEDTDKIPPDPPTYHGSDIADYIVGSNLDDYIYGHGGADSLYGKGGRDHVFGGSENDYLDGGPGGDWLFGEEGNDWLVGGAGADVLDGGTGKDTASYADSGAAVSIDLSIGSASGGDADGDTLIVIENLEGSEWGDAHGRQRCQYFVGAGRQRHAPRRRR